MVFGPYLMVIRDYSHFCAEKLFPLVLRGFSGARDQTNPCLLHMPSPLSCLSGTPLPSFLCTGVVLGLEPQPHPTTWGMLCTAHWWTSLPCLSSVFEIKVLLFFLTEVHSSFLCCSAQLDFSPRQMSFTPLSVVFLFLALMREQKIKKRSRWISFLSLNLLSSTVCWQGELFIFQTKGFIPACALPLHSAFKFSSLEKFCRDSMAFHLHKLYHKKRTAQ